MPRHHKKSHKSHAHKIMLSPKPNTTTNSISGKIGSSSTVFLIPSDASVVEELSLSPPATVKTKASCSQSLFTPEPSALRNDPTSPSLRAPKNGLFFTRGLTSPSTSTSPTLEELEDWFKKGADEFTLKV